MADGLTAESDETWLVELKQEALRRERPRDKPVGRWLGDFLDRDTPTGLLKAELALLDTCATGKPRERCVPAVKAPARQAAFQNDVQNNPVRADFLRFLALGGDESAPVHELGIELHNALIENDLDVRGGKCVGRLALINCLLRGDLLIEGASLGTLVLRGSRLGGVKGNGAKISGSVFLDENSVSDGDVLLSSAQIDGSLDCNSAKINGALNCAGAKIAAHLICDGATLAGGIKAQGAVIAADVKFLSLNAKRAVSLVNANIGGSLLCSGATLRVDHSDATIQKEQVMLDFSNAKINGRVELKSGESGPLSPLFMTEGAVRFVSAQIGGDLDFQGYSIAAVGTEQGVRLAVNAENVRVGGSVYFTLVFVPNGTISLVGAEISKHLFFSGGAFYNGSGCTICADGSKVSGTVGLLKTRSYGTVSLYGAKCGELNCSGGTFRNPGRMALECTAINVEGSVSLRNVGVKRCEARGEVHSIAHRSADISLAGADNLAIRGALR